MSVVALELVGVDPPKDLAVDEVLDLLELLGEDGLSVREVEPQAVGSDERSFLLRLLAERWLPPSVLMNR